MFFMHLHLFGSVGCCFEKCVLSLHQQNLRCPGRTSRGVAVDRSKKHRRSAWRMAERKDNLTPICSGWNVESINELFGFIDVRRPHVGLGTGLPTTTLKGFLVCHRTYMKTRSGSHNSNDTEAGCRAPVSGVMMS